MNMAPVLDVAHADCNSIMSERAFGADPQAAYDVIAAVREQTTKHLMVKLSPNVTDVTLIAKAAEQAGADSLSLINTITGMAIDLETRRPKIANITGGLSGPAIKPIALRMVWQAVRATNIPVVGIGGIISATDAKLGQLSPSVPSPGSPISSGP